MVTQIKCYLKKIAKFGFGIVFLFLLTSCPGSDEDCKDIYSSIFVDDLIILEPQQESYNQNDFLTFKIEIPASNTYFGMEQNLFDITSDFNALLITNSYLFQENNLEIIKGSAGEYENWFNMPYNSDTGMYELELKITLNRMGDYSFISAESIYLQGNDYCNRFRIDTNVVWNYTNGLIEFTVTE